MPNTRETVEALVSAFNVNNYDFNAVKTNFKLQSEGKKDYIVVSFDEGMNRYQCQEYLDSIKRKMVGEFYDAKEGRYEVVLNTGKSIFDVKSFPFNMKGKWSQNEQGRIEFLAPIDKGVIFNLKSHLAASLAKDVLEDMPTCNFSIEAPDKKGCLWLGKFSDKELCKEFEREFLFRMRERYENVSKNLLKGEGNSVYIKNVFDDARFIDSVTRYKAWLIGRDLQADSKSRSDVRAFKDSIIEFINQSTRVVTNAFLCASPLNRGETSILISIILSNRGTRFLTKEEARDINHKFNNPVLDDISDKTQATFKVNGSSGVYGIDFSNKEISHCVITKIIESSVINKDHELAIDPELRFRASTPVQSPVRVPNGPSSSLTGLSSPIQEFPTQSQGGALKESPRRGSETEKGTGLLQGLHNSVSLAVAGPSARMSSIVVNPGISGPSSQSLSAAQNVSAWTSQPIGAWPSSAPSAGFSSWNKSGSASTSQPIGYLSPLILSGGPRLWPPTQLSSSGPTRFSSRGSRLQPYVRPPSVHSEDSGLGSSRPASTSSTVYSADSGFESRPSSTFTDMSNYENQKELTEKELIINKFLKNVKEIAAKMIDTKQIITKERIDKYIEGFANTNSHY